MTDKHCAKECMACKVKLPNSKHKSCKTCGKIGCYNACPYNVGLGTPYPCARLEIKGIVDNLNNERVATLVKLPDKPSLSEKRQETFKKLNEMNKDSRLHKKEWETIWRNIFEIIERQDKEFIRALKEEMPYFGYNQDVSGNKCFVNISKIIDKIAGDNLI